MCKAEQAKLNNKCAISILENTKKLLARTTLAKSLVLTNLENLNERR